MIYAYNLPEGSTSDYTVTWDPDTKQLRYVRTPPGADRDWEITPTTIYNTWAKVGIGIDSPREKLDVAGNIRVNNIYPRSNNDYNLGTSTYRWHALYVYDIYPYGKVRGHWLPGSNNAYDLGSSSYRWRGLYVYNIYPYGRIYGSLLPGSSGTYDLGSSTYKWRHLYLSGRVYSSLIPGSNNLYNLGSTSYKWKSLYVYNIYPYGRIYGHLLPGYNGYYDLGSSTYKWRNLYFTGKVYNHLTPGSNNLYNIGSSSYRWKSIYVYEVYPYGKVHGSWIPSSNNAYDLGSSSYRWRSLYIYNIYPYGKVYGSLVPGSNNAYDLGSSTYKWRNLFFSGKVYNNLIPGSDNTYNLGSSSYRWKRLYLSGYMRIGTSTNYGQLSYSTSDKSFVFSKSMRPSSTNSLDLGTSSYRWRNLYTYTIYLGSGSYPRLAAGSYTSLKIKTSHGYLEAGPRNTDWCHFVTDRPSFWFNKKVTVAGNVEPYKGNTYSRHLGSSTSRWANLYLKGTVYLYHGSTSKYARMQYIDPYIVFSKGLRPTSKYGADLGTSYYRWNTVYCKTVNTGDLVLSNGNITWILFEGTDGLYIYNPDTGKQYKLLMEEVPATYTARGG